MLADAPKLLLERCTTRKPSYDRPSFLSILGEDEKNTLQKKTTWNHFHENEILVPEKGSRNCFPKKAKKAHTRQRELSDLRTALRIYFLRDTGKFVAINEATWVFWKSVKTSWFWFLFAWLTPSGKETVENLLMTRFILWKLRGENFVKMNFIVFLAAVFKWKIVFYALKGVINHWNLI